MRQQKFGLNPATGRIEHYWIDRGPHKVKTRGTPVIPSTAKTTDNFGRKRAAV